MKKILIAVVVAVVIIGGGYYYMSAPASKETKQEPVVENRAPTQKEKILNEVVVEPKVTLKNFAFSPNVLRVKAGTKVVWTNEDIAGHTVTGDTGVFGSKILGQGKSFERVFSEKGSFSYHCEPHPSMTGTIIVE